MSTGMSRFRRRRASDAAERCRLGPRVHSSDITGTSHRNAGEPSLWGTHALAVALALPRNGGWIAVFREDVLANPFRRVGVWLRA